MICENEEEGEIFRNRCAIKNQDDWFLLFPVTSFQCGFLVAQWKRLKEKEWEREREREREKEEEEENKVRVRGREFLLGNAWRFVLNAFPSICFLTLPNCAQITSLSACDVVSHSFFLSFFLSFFPYLSLSPCLHLLAKV